ncbi:hypothetical protein P692DRAFT_2014344 [Suillus brevipes Sb2]|nr:hypothetical protein P692DRAFT_2014344 [Suillus brevipes Sb2]
MCWGNPAYLLSLAAMQRVTQCEQCIVFPSSVQIFTAPIQRIANGMKIWSKEVIGSRHIYLSSKNIKKQSIGVRELALKSDHGPSSSAKEIIMIMISFEHSACWAW